MGAEAGANPFGHGHLIFSSQKDEQSPIGVIDSIGYYSQPSTTTNPIIKIVKQFLGLNVDLQGGHGVLKHEVMHELDGNGLHGISFEVTQEQFIAIKNDYEKTLKTQQEVIEELNRELTNKGIEPSGHTRYIAEKAKAAADRKEPRLKPFHITMDLTWKGLDSSQSYTCKDYSLDLLQRHKIITDKIKDQFTYSKATKAFPIFSGISLPPIRLISTGDPEKVVSKRTAKVFYNHTWEKNSLFWASPIQTMENNLLRDKFDETLNYSTLKNILNRKRRTEYFLREKIREIQEGKEQNKQYLHYLHIQLKRVQNLALLFNNSRENQNAKLLDQRLLRSNQVLQEASLAIHIDKINYSFIMRAFESVSFNQAILGMILMIASVAVIAAVPVVGVGLLAASSLLTAYQLHGFYKEEIKFDEMRESFYNFSLKNQTRELGQPYVMAI
ncbi:hypothetical protein EP47_08305 [Legionella norrlandica]|uniref:Uncharacterized protein n=2 Tax=Legionella norrlandica TaxID=1498499 RepID=A0A0A2SNV6_9GAMM|nr:hypothetical protein EP47_08305 [Legionella norrlandica]